MRRKQEELERVCVFGVGGTLGRLPRSIMPELHPRGDRKGTCPQIPGDIHLETVFVRGLVIEYSPEEDLREEAGVAGSS